MGPFVSFSTVILLVLSNFAIQAQPAANYRNAQIVWDSTTLTLVQPGGLYGRMARLPDREILCAFEWNAAIYVRRSADEGQTWSDPVQAASFPFGTANNPELLLLDSGAVLLSYNQRPTDGVHPYAIAIAFSADNGRSWSASTVVFQAGIVSSSGCWEPSQIQLASGEIQLFFSNQQPYPTTGEQEISVISSFDDGATWSSPAQASFRPGHRDGMAVPLSLANQSGVVLSIEDNGLSGAFKPAIVSPATATRWAALAIELPAAVYAGAPYLRQFPTGETILSVQSADGRGSPGTMDYSRMVVYLGDSDAHSFVNGSLPFTVPANASGLWNSLFIKDSVTVTAISSTTLGGVSGVWAIDGYLQYQGTVTAPSLVSAVDAGGPAGAVAPETSAQPSPPMPAASSMRRGSSPRADPGPRLGPAVRGK